MRLLLQIPDSSLASWLLFVIRIVRQLKSNPTFRGRFDRRLHHPLQDIGDDLDLLIVQLHRVGQLLQLSDQFAGRGQQPPQSREGTHDLNVGFNGDLRIQHTGQHSNAVFSENPRQRPATAVTQT